MNSSFIPSHEEIAQRAHDLWEQRGRPENQETEHWLQAERELQHEQGQTERVRPGSAGPAAAFSERGKAGRTASGKAAS